MSIWPKPSPPFGVMNPPQPTPPASAEQCATPRCVNDTNGDGDCHLCYKQGGCPMAQLIALQSERDALKSTLAALQAERDELRAVSKRCVEAIRQIKDLANVNHATRKMMVIVGMDLVRALAKTAPKAGKGAT